MSEDGMEQIVVSLCEQSGNMVRPWAERGFECYAVDLENDGSTEQAGGGVIHYIEADVRDWEPPTDDVRIGFAFPPCTDLAVSGARWMQDKGLYALADAIELVAACQETLSELGCPWMLENPVSTLSTYWREPDYKFDPFQYDGYTDEDEAYTKETWLWTGGGFTMPRPMGADRDEADDRIHAMPPSEERSTKRAETPTGFATAVYLAHEREGYARLSTEQATLNAVADGGNSLTDTTDNDRSSGGAE